MIARPTVPIPKSAEQIEIPAQDTKPTVAITKSADQPKHHTSETQPISEKKLVLEKKPTEEFVVKEADTAEQQSRGFLATELANSKAGLKPVSKDSQKQQKQPQPVQQDNQCVLLRFVTYCFRRTAATPIPVSVRIIPTAAGKSLSEILFDGKLSTTLSLFIFKSCSKEGQESQGLNRRAQWR